MFTTTPLSSTLSSILHRPRTSLDTEALADVARSLLSARQIWSGFARFDPDIRRPVRLFADDLIEAWVVGWFSGQTLGLHDHGDSAGAVVVAEGRLRETALVGGRLETRTLDRGIVRHLPPDTVHAISNVDTRAATSLHVYSPPIDQMTHFDPASLEPVETVAVAPEPAILPRAVARLLRIDQRV